MDMHADRTLAKCVANVVAVLVFGKTMKHSDPAFHNYVTIMEEGFGLIGVAAIINYFPVLRYGPASMWMLRPTTYHYIRAIYILI